MSIKTKIRSAASHLCCAIRDSNPGRKHAPCACADMGGFHHTPRPMAPRPRGLQTAKNAGIYTIMLAKNHDLLPGSFQWGRRFHSIDWTVLSNYSPGVRMLSSAAWPKLLALENVGDQCSGFPCWRLFFRASLCTRRSQSVRCQKDVFRKRSMHAPVRS